MDRKKYALAFGTLAGGLGVFAAGYLFFRKGKGAKLFHLREHGGKEGPVPKVDDRHFRNGRVGFKDRVDEASWESFPASDPPGW